MDDTDPIDYTKEKCVSFSYLASIALLRGKTQSLKVLRDGIRGLEELKEIAGRGVNKNVASELLKLPMTEMANTAGHKYHAMLFSEKDGKKCSPGMCETRTILLRNWLDFTRKRVLKHKSEWEARTLAAEAKKLLSGHQGFMLTLDEEEENVSELNHEDSDE